MRRILVCFLVLAACTGDDGGPVSIDSLPSALKSAYCNLYAKCGLIDDVGLCQTLNLDADVDPDLIAAVNAGLIAYDADQAAACLAAISNASCERNHMHISSEACDLAFTGTVAAGGECGQSQECISDQCDIPSCPDACCKGTCVDGIPETRPHVGDACGMGGQCVDSFCDGTTLVCTAYKALGDTCQSTSQCVSGVCNGTCMASPGPGDPCTQQTTSGGCADIGYRCSTTTMTCVAYGLAGDACSTTEPCSPVYVCDPATSKCVLGPRVGEPCSQTARCIDTSFCSSTTGTCTAPQADGATCQSDSECAGDCDPTTNTCVTPPICF